MKPRNCPQCNASVSDQAAFCRFCGCQILEQPNQLSVPTGEPLKGFKKQRKTKHKMFVIVAALLVLVLIMGSVAIFLLNRTPVPSVYDQYVTTMGQLKEKGDYYIENGMTLQAQYSYGIAGASISALRFAIDNILYLKGESENLSDVVGDAYGDWETIAAISYASPYPYYFEGLLYHIQGEEDEAKECYKNAIMNPNFPQKGFSLYDLNDLSVEELLALKEELVLLEKSIYAAVKLDLNTCQRNPMNFNDGYLRALAKEALGKDPVDYEGAQQYYMAALQVNPFEPKNFASLALYAIYMEDIDAALYYTNEGLWIDEDDEALNQIKALLQGEEVGETK